jgi:plasmid stabilization system protein ParE
MIRAVRISPRARRHIASALEWWSTNRPHAPTMLQHELANALELLGSHDRIGEQQPSTRIRELRRLALGQSGFSIYYSVERDGIRVLALWHQSRGSQPPL